MSVHKKTKDTIDCEWIKLEVNSERTQSKQNNNIGHNNNWKQYNEIRYYYLRLRCRHHHLHYSDIIYTHFHIPR